MSRQCKDPRRRLAVVALAASALVGHAAAFSTYYWNSPVSGLTSDSSKWNPTGVPGVSDWLGFATGGVYTVSFASTTPQSGKLLCWSGVVTLQALFNHTTGPMYVTLNDASEFVRLNRGTLNIDFLHLGDYDTNSTLVLEADGNYTGWIHSKGMGNPSPADFGDRIGNAGNAQMYIYSGSRYICERTDSTNGKMAMAVLPGSQASLTVHGSGGLPVRSSLLTLTGGATLGVGVQGAATLNIENRGSVLVSGDLRAAALGGSSGIINVGAPASTNNAYLTAQAQLLLGGNGAAGNDAGHAELNVQDKAIVTVAGLCDVGDPDNDAGSLLRVYQGGSIRFNGGLKFRPTAGVAMDLQGGLTHVQTGAFEWPAGKYMQISSTAGTPELRIDNGVLNTGPSTGPALAQLFVARNGAGTFTLSGAGTAFQMGTGATVLGDLVGGVGVLTLDAGAHLTSAGQVVVGNQGRGEWHVSAGSVAEVGNLALGTALNGSGYVDVYGTDAQLYVEDKLWIGGGYNGVGGNGLLSVRFGGRLEIEHVHGGINPALTTVYPNGSLHVFYSDLTTPGDIACAGDLTLWEGELAAQSLTLTGIGSMRGYGNLSALVNNAGRIDPGFDFNQMHTIPIQGGYTQFAQGRYVVDLDASEGPVSDRLEIAGPAALDGILELRPEIGFEWIPGHSWRVLSCTERSGSFSSVTWQGAPLNGQVELVYGPNFVDVRVPGGVTPAVEADVTAVRFAPSGGPSRPSFALELPGAAQVRIVAYDLRGREVGVLFDGRVESARQSFALEERGRTLASGVYFARAEIELRGRKSVHTARTVLVH